MGGCYVFVQCCKSKWFCLTFFDNFAKCFVEVVVIMIMFGLDEGRFC